MLHQGAGLLWPTAVAPPSTTVLGYDRAVWTLSEENHMAPTREASLRVNQAEALPSLRPTRSDPWDDVRQTTMLGERHQKVRDAPTPHTHCPVPAGPVVRGHTAPRERAHNDPHALQN